MKYILITSLAFILTECRTVKIESQMKVIPDHTKVKMEPAPCSGIGYVWYDEKDKRYHACDCCIPKKKDE